jgi:feruloyl esterase
MKPLGLLGAIGCSLAMGQEMRVAAAEEAGCRDLVRTPALNVLRAEIRTAASSRVPYCHVTGMIGGGIRYHVQLPLPRNWNGRFLYGGDSGKDGVLQFNDPRVAQGYAFANSNLGHDVGAEPGASFGFNNRQAEIDFGYRATHVSVVAAKTLIRAYYGRPQKLSYYEGCSQGGRVGLMEAQRYPDDFDAIVVGAPVNWYQQQNAALVWHAQQVFRDRFAGALAFDTDGDGRLDSTTKLKFLAAAVLKKYDARDGIADGVLDDPLACPFQPEVDLKDLMCPGDRNADGCFTRRQIQTIQDMYRGAYDSKGTRVYWGKAKGSEPEWADAFFPMPANQFNIRALRLSGDHLNYIFYDVDPGVAPRDLLDVTQKLNKTGPLPEWGWWEFNIDDFTAGKAKTMMGIMNATDPDLSRFLIRNNGKLILYHGWCDYGPAPEASIGYFKNVVQTTFGGNAAAAAEKVRLFLAPGMGHCSGGAGPNDWDKLAPMVEWVENGKAPDRIVATHSTQGKVDNERPLCPYPQKAVYVGPAGRQNDRANWIAANFACR